MAEKDKLQNIDLHVGGQLKKRRKQLKLGQEELAKLVGISYQQIQKYENGSNRIPASRLLVFARTLNVPINYFYEGVNLLESRVAEKVYICTERQNPLKILLVEDNPADEMIIRNAILGVKAKVEVETVNNGVDALTYIRDRLKYDITQRPCLIILDLNLPKKDGLSVLKEIKQNYSLNYIPVVILSHTINTKDLLKSYRLHAAGFVYKFFEVDKFNKAMKNVVEYWANTAILPDMQYEVAADEEKKLDKDVN